MKTALSLNRAALSLLSLFTFLFFITTSSYAATFTVTNINDSGTGSLRQAILDSNATPMVDDEIVFMEGLSGVIPTEGDPVDSNNVYSGQMAILDDVTIIGPGPDVVTIDAQMNGRIFIIDDGDVPNAFVVSISGLMLINGLATGVSPANIGGAIFNNDRLSIDSCVFENNSAADDGGAIFNNGIITEITNSTFSGNRAEAAGGAIFNNGIITEITNITFSGNSADDGGGAISNIAIITEITNSTFSGNSALNGGAIFNNFSSGTIEEISNSTFSGNSSTGGTGTITNMGSTINISFTTIANNDGADALSNPGTGTINIKNSIVGNNAGRNCFNATSGTFNAFGVNLATDDNCPGFTQVTSMELNLDPMLLKDNGGSTQTIALCTGLNMPSAGCLAAPSAAIDMVTDCTDLAMNPVNVDQRYFPRPFPNPGNCDVGAFETQPTGMLTIVKETDPPGGMDFEFLGTGFPEGCDLMDMFMLDDMEMAMCILPLGMYTVEEEASLEFDLEIECTDGTMADSPTSVTVDLGAGEDVACTFTNTEKFTLEIVLGGSGVGNVSSAPSGIDCGDGGVDCDVFYDFNTVVTLTATPDAVSTFVGFTGDSDCADGVVTMDADTVCTATFDFIPLILNPIFPGVGSNVNSIEVQQATPNGNVAFIWGFMPGSAIVGGPTCNGIELGMNDPRLLGIISAGADQTANFFVYIPLNPAFQNPVLVQAVDIPTCRTSEVVTNIILNE